MYIHNYLYMRIIEAIATAKKTLNVYVIHSNGNKDNRLYFLFYYVRSF